MRDVTRVPSLRMPAPSGAYPEVIFQGGSKRALAELAAAGLGSAGPESAGKSDRGPARPPACLKAPPHGGDGGRPAFQSSPGGAGPPRPRPPASGPSQLPAVRAGPPRSSGLRAENGLYPRSGLQPGQGAQPPRLCPRVWADAGGAGPSLRFGPEPAWPGLPARGASLGLSCSGSCRGFCSGSPGRRYPGGSACAPAGLERWVGPSSSVKQCHTGLGQDRPGRRGLCLRPRSTTPLGLRGVSVATPVNGQRPIHRG